MSGHTNTRTEGRLASHTPLLSLSSMYVMSMFPAIVGTMSARVFVTHNKCRVVLGADGLVKCCNAISGPEVQVSSSILQNLDEICTTFQLRRHGKRTFCQTRRKTQSGFCVFQGKPVLFVEHFRNTYCFKAAAECYVLLP